MLKLHLFCIRNEAVNKLVVITERLSNFVAPFIVPLIYDAVKLIDVSVGHKVPSANNMLGENKHSTRLICHGKLDAVAPERGNERTDHKTFQEEVIKFQIKEG